MNLLTFLAETSTYNSEHIMKGMACIAAALAVFTGFSQGLGEGHVAAAAVEAIGKNPEAAGQIRSSMILGIALTETTGIYGLLISILLLFLVAL